MQNLYRLMLFPLEILGIVDCTLFGTIMGKMARRMGIGIRIGIIKPSLVTLVKPLST